MHKRGHAWSEAIPSCGVRAPGQPNIFVSAPGDDSNHALSPYLLPRGASTFELRERDLAIRDRAHDAAASADAAGDLIVYLDPRPGIERLTPVSN